MKRNTFNDTLKIIKHENTSLQFLHKRNRNQKAMYLTLGGNPRAETNPLQIISSKLFYLKSQKRLTFSVLFVNNYWAWLVKEQLSNSSFGALAEASHF